MTDSVKIKRPAHDSPCGAIPIGAAALVLAIAVAQRLRELPSIQTFIKDYPGIAQFASSVDSGVPWWLQLQHFLNMLFMMFIIRAGIQILADHPRLYWTRDCTPGTEWFRFQHPVPEGRIWTSKDDSVTVPGWLGIPGGRHSSGLARLHNMRHRLTILVYEVNGAPVGVLHGAPLRLRCENELGFKMVKWIAAIEFVRDFVDLGAGQGGYNEDHEFYGYRMPIGRLAGERHEPSKTRPDHRSSCRSVGRACWRNVSRSRRKCRHGLQSRAIAAQ